MAWPDLFEHYVLLDHPEFRFESEDGVGGKTLCPFCRCNKYVKMINKTGGKGGSRGVRSAIDVDGMRFFVVCPIYECSNPSCAGKNENPTPADKCSTHTFHIYTQSCWEQYPREVWELYDGFLWRDVADGEDGELFVTDELCNTVLDDDTNFSKLERQFEERYDRFKARAIRSYMNFLVGMQRDHHV